MSKNTSRRPRAKKTPKVLYEYRSAINEKSKLYNLNNFVLEIDKNFPLVYNLDSISIKEETNESNKTSQDCKQNDHKKIKFIRSKSLTESQVFKSKESFSQKSHLPCFMLHFYFIYLLLCVVIMCSSFGFYYTMVSTRLKIEALEKSINNKYVSMISAGEIRKDNEKIEEYLDYENLSKESSVVFKPVVESLSWFSKKIDFLNQYNGTFENKTVNHSKILEDFNQDQISNSTFYSNLTTNSKYVSLSNKTTNLELRSTTKIFVSGPNLVDLIKNRHRKRLESMKRKAFLNSNDFNYQCSLKSIQMSPISLNFMGVFHSNWMNNINSNDKRYYITKGFKGLSILICQNLEQLKSYRCHRHITLKYGYYGTGHTIYKNFIFYHREGTRDLIVQSLDGTEVNIFSAPEDSLCCSQDHNLYSIKHSGLYDFETDEHGLWLIYRDAAGYVIAKIDEKNFKKLEISKKWYVKVKHKVANMFIQCGQLYALKDSSNSPAEIDKICDFFIDIECVTDSKGQIFNVSISNRQITSLSYNPDSQLLYSVDGGSLVYYKLRV